MGTSSEKESVAAQAPVDALCDQRRDEPETPRAFPRGSEVHGLLALIAAADSEQDGIRILLVGPRCERRTLLRETLELAGYGVFDVDLDDARALLDHTRFDLAIATVFESYLGELYYAAPPDLPILCCDAEPIRGLLLLTAVRDAIRARYS